MATLAPIEIVEMAHNHPKCGTECVLFQSGGIVALLASKKNMNETSLNNLKFHITTCIHLVERYIENNNIYQESSDKVISEINTLQLVVGMMDTVSTKLKKVKFHISYSADFENFELALLDIKEFCNDLEKSLKLPQTKKWIHIGNEISMLDY